jgi:tight adherence protein B
MRDGIRAGLSVPEALAGLAEHGPEVLRPELTRLVRDMRLVGLPRALAEARERLADPLFDMTATALALNEAVGGRNVSAVLDRLAHAARGQLAAQEELRVQQARNVLSARIVAAMPLVVLVAARALNPQYMAVFDTPGGQLILAGCAASVALGYAAMRWITRLPGEPRVLGAWEERP